MCTAPPGPRTCVRACPGAQRAQLGRAREMGAGLGARIIGFMVRVGLARLGDGLQVHIVVQLHVLGVDADDLQAAGLVRHADVDLAVEAPKAPQRGVDAARAAPARVSAAPLSPPSVPQQCCPAHVAHDRHDREAPGLHPLAINTWRRGLSGSDAPYLPGPAAMHGHAHAWNAGNTTALHPQRLRAGARLLGRFVAPMTMTCARDFSPSISVSSCDTMRRSTSPCAPQRRLP
jgi:hypothetical protein